LPNFIVTTLFMRAAAVSVWPPSLNVNRSSAGANFALSKIPSMPFQPAGSSGTPFASTSGLAGAPWVAWGVAWGVAWAVGVGAGVACVLLLDVLDCAAASALAFSTAALAASATSLGICWPPLICTSATPGTPLIAGIISLL